MSPRSSSMRALRRHVGSNVYDGFYPPSPPLSADSGPALCKFNHHVLTLSALFCAHRLDLGLDSPPGGVPLSSFPIFSTAALTQARVFAARQIFPLLTGEGGAPPPPPSAVQRREMRPRNFYEHKTCFIIEKFSQRRASPVAPARGLRAPVILGVFKLMFSKYIRTNTSSKLIYFPAYHQCNLAISQAFSGHIFHQVLSRGHPTRSQICHET